MILNYFPICKPLDKNTGKLLKVGTEAQQMLGKTPGNIVAIRPLREGVISDYDMTERMLREFIRKVAPVRVFKPRVVICVPSGITEVEERAVIDAGIQAGARRVSSGRGNTQPMVIFSSSAVRSPMRTLCRLRMYLITASLKASPATLMEADSTMPDREITAAWPTAPGGAWSGSTRCRTEP